MPLKTIVVTGAAQGVGLAAASLLAQLLFWTDYFVLARYVPSGELGSRKDEEPLLLPRSQSHRGHRSDEEERSNGHRRRAATTLVPYSTTRQDH
jgi:hypothetical protein